MKRYILKKRLFAAVFLAVLFSFSILNFVHSFDVLSDLFAAENRQNFTVDVIETTINENLYERMKFIETYGFIQVLMDKRESNNFSYVKDEDGFLHYSSFYREEDPNVFDYALRVKRVQDYVNNKGTKVLFVVPPCKYNRNYTEFRTGLPVNDPEMLVDELLFFLNRLGVVTLDLRQSIPNEDLSYEESFFRSDHHWTIPAAFYATGKIVDCINEEFGQNLDPDNYYTNIDNYEVVKYYNGMFGSMGRKTGATFCPIENFTAIWPKYEGNYYRVSVDEEEWEEEISEGNFSEALLDISVLTKNRDPYSDSQYSLYISTISNYEKVINLENEQGPKVLMIRDSYFSPVIAFMSGMCSEIHALWELEENIELNIEEYIKQDTFDYIIIEVYPYNIEDRAFDYFRGN